MTEILAGYVSCILESIILIILCGMFLHSRWSRWFYFIPGIVSTVITLHLVDYLGLSFRIWQLLVSIVMDLLLIHIYFHGVVLKKLFFLIGFMLSSAALQGLTLAFAQHSATTPFNINDSGDSRVTMALALYLIFMFLILFIFERFRTVNTVLLSNRIWLCLLSIPVMSLFMVWWLFPFGKVAAPASEMRLVAGMSLFLLFINITVFSLYRMNALKATLERQNRDMQSALDRERVHYSNLLSGQEIMSDHVHDYLRVLNFLETLLTAGQNQEALHHLHKLLGGIRETQAEKRTGNPQIDALLSQKLSECSVLGIEASVEGRLPHTISYDALDLCVIIGNALDNAVEACVRQNITGKCITLSILLDCGCLLIEVSNFSEPPTPYLKTSKANPHGHGRGIGIMRRVSEKYNGSFICEYTNGKFIVSVLLQEPPR